jgi:hypothetical protein
MNSTIPDDELEEDEEDVLELEVDEELLEFDELSEVLLLPHAVNKTKTIIEINFCMRPPHI